MKLKITKIKELIVFEKDVYSDDRGYFCETSNEKWFQSDIKFVQSNVSFSKEGTLRGLHFQEAPFAQGKLVQVLQGEVFDVAIDLRKDSNTYGQWHGEILSDANHLAMYIPEGFAHGFLALKDSLFTYSCTNFYSPDCAKTIKWNDEQLNIFWPKEPAILSNSDKNGLSLKEYENV